MPRCTTSARQRHRKRLSHQVACLGPAAAPAATPAAAGRFVVPLPPGTAPPGNRIETVDIPPPTYTVVPRLEAGSQASLDYLNEHGYVVIASVLSAEEVAYTLDLAWNFIEALAPAVRRDDPASWTREHWPSDWGSTGSHHSAAQWFVRGTRGVHRAWAALVGTNDLICSFDQLSLYPAAGPAEDSFAGSLVSTGTWYHTDQAPGHRSGPQEATQGSHGLHRDYCQGFVALQRTSPESDGNVVVPRSHREWLQWGVDYFDPSEAGGKRGIRYDLLTPDKMPGGCRGITAHLEAGDAFVWDSRTLHGAARGSGGAAAAAAVTGQLARAASYVCLSPRRAASAEVIAQRHAALASGTGFGHQAHHLHDESMMRVVRDGHGPQVKYEELTAQQKKLVG